MYYKKFLLIFLTFNFIFIPIFSFADDYIEENDFFIDTEIEATTDLSEVPNINARHAVVLDRASNTILYGKNENEQCKMASTTKILTAIVVLENCNDLTETVTVTKKAARNRWNSTRVIHNW